MKDFDPLAKRRRRRRRRLSERGKREGHVEDGGFVWHSGHDQYAANTVVGSGPFRE